MPVEPLAFASVFLNSFLLLSGGIACAYLTMSAFCRPRHSLVVFWLYFILKMTVVAFVDALGFFGIGAQNVLYGGEVLIALFGLFAYAVIYYCWDESFVKVGILSISADLLTGLAMALSFSFTALLRGDMSEPGYIGYLDIFSFIRPVVMVLLFYLLLQLVKPIGRALVERKLTHERIFFVLIAAIVMTSCTSRLVIGQGDEMRSFFGPLLMSMLLIPVLALLVIYEWRRVRKRRAYLASSKALMAQCDETLRNQALFLASSRATLDGLRDRIAYAGENNARGDSQRHLDALLSLCDQLRFGTYSDNPALDVVLLGYEQRFAEAGLQVNYRISPLDCNSEQVALAAQGLLEWAYQAYRRSRSRGIAWRGKPTTDAPSTLGFRAFRRANQLFFEVRLSLGSGRIPYMRISDRLPTAGTVVNELREGNRLGIRLLVEGDAA